MKIDNVLIVDDHACIVDGIIAELREGFELNNVSIANSPDEAIKQVTNNKFDLCILDLSFHTEESGINISQINYIRKICESVHLLIELMGIIHAFIVFYPNNNSKKCPKVLTSQQKRTRI